MCKPIEAISEALQSCNECGNIIARGAKMYKHRSKNPEALCVRCGLKKCESWEKQKPKKRCNIV